MANDARSDAAQLNVGPAPVGELSYEQARDELITIVAALEQGTATLEESIGLWERGNALAARCDEWLAGARARLDAAAASSESPATQSETN